MADEGLMSTNYFSGELACDEESIQNNLNSSKIETDAMNRLKPIILFLCGCLVAVCIFTTVTLRNIRVSKVRIQFKADTPPQVLTPVLHIPEKKTGKAIFDNTTTAIKLHKQVFTKILGDHTRVVLANFPIDDAESAITMLGLVNLLDTLHVEWTIACGYSKCGNFSSVIQATKDKPTSMVLVSVGHGDLEFINSTFIKEIESSATEVVLFDPWSQLPEESYSEVNDHVVLITYVTSTHRKETNPIPHLGFSIGHQDRFIYPFYDFVVLRSATETSCDVLSNTEVTCSSKDWDTSKEWRLPKSTWITEQIYLNSYSRFMCALRGKVVISDQVVGHVVASLFGIPHVIVEHSDNIRKYFGLWHLDDNLYLSKDAAGVARKAEFILNNMHNVLPSIDSAKAIVKN